MKKNFLKYLTSILGIAFFVVACGEKDLYKGEDDEEEPPTELAQKAENLKFTSFVISPDDNNNIYGEISFDLGSTTMIKDIKYYETDLSNLKVSFKSNADKVVVNNVTQKSGVTSNDFTKTVTYRLYTPGGEFKDFNVTLTNSDYSGIPVVYIRTDGNKEVDSREIWFPGTVVIDGQQEDYEEYRGTMEIKGRGHNSWTVKEKRAYTMKLTSKDPVLGMNKHKRWVFIPSVSDKTMLRNKVAYEIGKRTDLAWTPECKFVQVILNGRFQGTYLLCEQIRVDKNRVNIVEIKPESTSGEAITGGYLFEIDRYYDGVDNVNQFRPTRSDLPVIIKNPDDKYINVQQFNYIKGYFEDLEALLYSSTFPDKGEYLNYIDIKSFADWWIVHELTHNTEPNVPGSCYMHKDQSGKLCAGPIWDFDLTTFKESSSFKLIDKALWYPILLKDPVFKAKVKEQWLAYRSKFESIPSFIDEQAAYLETSVDFNFSVYSPTGNFNQDESLPWEEAVTKMKKNYSNRLEWMDAQIQAW